MYTLIKYSNVQMLMVNFLNEHIKKISQFEKTINAMDINI